MGLLPGFERAEIGEQQYKRGEIFYVNNGSREQVGSETKKDRPAIIVSCDANNKHSSVLEMVFLTTQPKAELPTHVTIRSTGRASTALCEQPTPVAVERLNNYLGEVTEEEMQRIDTALLIGLGINYDKRMQKTLETITEGKTASGGICAEQRKRILNTMKMKSRKKSASGRWRKKTSVWQRTSEIRSMKCRERPKRQSEYPQSAPHTSNCMKIC